jgi:hypothetical protein
VYALSTDDQFLKSELVENVPSEENAYICHKNVGILGLTYLATCFVKSSPFVRCTYPVQLTARLAFAAASPPNA